MVILFLFMFSLQLTLQGITIDREKNVESFGTFLGVSKPWTGPGRAGTRAG